MDNEVQKNKCMLVPCGARIVVEHDSFKYEGKLIIPEVAKRQPTTGYVVAMGPDVEIRTKQDINDLTMPGFVLGDRVVFAMYSGTLLVIAGQPAYRVLQQDEILAKITTKDVLEYTAA